METRVFQIGKIRADEMTADATLSTEYPVRRYDGLETLSHDPGAVDLSRAPLPLIVGHDGGKLPVGVVESLRIEGKSLKGVLRFSKSATDIWQDVKDGILRNLSIGYQIIERTKTKVGYVASKWMPYECSLVAAGADPAAGIGREFKTLEVVKMDKNDLMKERKIAVDGMVELAGKDMTSENKEQFDRFKEAVDAYDRRLEALMDLDKVKKPEFKKVPDLKTESREIRFEGGPALDRSFKGMFGAPVYDDAAIRAFRATMNEGTLSAGAASVPEPLAAKWLDDSLPAEIVRPAATVWPMESETRKVPGWDSLDTSSTLYGGFAMEFISEGGTGTKQTGKLRAITMTANKAGIFCDVSSELYEDGLDFAAQLEMALKRSIGYGMDSYFFNGVGAGQPVGITNDPALIAISKETGQSADTLVWETIVKQFARMHPACRANAKWYCNESVLSQLLQLSIQIGTAGSWINPLSDRDGKFYILGKEVVFTPHLPALGNANDFIFADLSQYYIGLRRDMRIQSSDIPSWTEDLRSYRILVRFDGQGSWDKVATPANGDTLSWVVGIEERA